MLHVIF